LQLIKKKKKTHREGLQIKFPFFCVIIYLNRFIRWSCRAFCASKKV